METRNSKSDGNWLCPDGPYRNFVKSLIKNDPRLKQRDAKAIAQGTVWPSPKLRIVTLELEAGKPCKQAAEWSDLGKFRQHLDSTAASTIGQRNIILVEGLSPDLIDILGTRFDIHPSFFVDHERVVVFTSNPTRTADPHPLPSCINWNASTKGMTLKYFEPMEITPGPQSFRLSCANNGRHVGIFRSRGRISPVAVVRRKCSIWPISYPGGGYTCVILCDPPLTAVSMKGGPGAHAPSEYPVRTFPYQGGYLDFMNGQTTHQGAVSGPPRSSMLDDLRYYLLEHGLNLPDPSNPKCPAFFVEKIVASQYLTLTSFMSSLLSTQQWDLSRQEDMARFSLNRVEQQWSDIQSWERRLNEYCNDIEELMIKLGIPFQDPDPSSIKASALSKTHADFQFLWMRLKGLKHRAEQVNAATSGLASIAGNRQAHQEQQLALNETQKAKALTLIGLVFIPLAYTATLFSMNERYMPGASLFWIYFLVSIPLIFAVILAYFVLSRLHGGPLFTFKNVFGTRRTASPDTNFSSKKPLFDAPYFEHRR